MEEIKTLGNLTKEEEKVLRELVALDSFKFYQRVMSGYLRIKEKNAFAKKIDTPEAKYDFARNQGEYIGINGWIVGFEDRLDEVAQQRGVEPPKKMKKK